MTLPGDVVLVRFPLTNGYEAKVRPALVVALQRLDHEDPLVTVAAITSSERRLESRSDFVLPIDHVESAGLDRPSAIQIPKLFTTQESKIVASIGVVSDGLLQEVLRQLRAYLTIQ